MPLYKKIRYPGQCLYRMRREILADLHGTTIISARRHGMVVVGGDGQVTFGHTIMKNNARKVRRLYNNKILAGFAGGTADAFTLF